MIKEIRDKKAQHYRLKALCKRQKAEGRRQKALVIVLLLLCSFSVQAQNKFPQGKWEVKQVTVEKSMNDSVQITEYNTVAEIQQYSLPIEWQINKENILWSYSNGREDVFNYILENDQLIITIASTMYSYQYSISENTMRLVTVKNYKYNSQGHTDDISEKMVIILQQK